MDATFRRLKARARSIEDSLRLNPFGLVGLNFSLGQVVVPSELQNCRCCQEDCQGENGSLEFPENDVNGQRHLADLPNNADSKVEHVAQKIIIVQKIRL